MKTLFQSLKIYIIVPFVASLPGFALNLFGTSWMNMNFAVVPLLAALIYILCRKKWDMALAAKANGIIFLALLVIFTGMMAVAKGNAESLLMSSFSYLILPFLPIMLLPALMGRFMLLYLIALLTYLVSFLVCAFFAKIDVRKILIPAGIAVICIVASTLLYSNRPSVKYGGHGFEYMHGFSSTDFTDYMVYAENSRLAELDHTASLIIENADDMPVMDGAEACYPLYAAFAKAVYKDIDKIELAALDSDYQRENGQIVSFTNTISGFDRLIMGGTDAEKYGHSIDMFFGAGPSARQMDMAEGFDVALEITPIGREAFVFFVEADNPVEDLTSEQLRAIYHGDLKNWSELGGKKQEILAFQRPVNSGSQTMMEYFMGDVSLKEPETFERVDAMSGVIRQVAQYANEKGAIGYSFRYFLEELNQEKGVKMLSVDGVYPTLENIENGSYPLVTNVCLVTRRDETNPNVRKMIDFILSEEGREIVRKTGYAGVKQE